MDGVSSAAIELLLQNLITAVKEEYNLFKGLEKHAQQLQTTLEIIQAYLNDAEKKSISQDAVKVWLRKLETVAFNADNVLDEFRYHLLHKKIKKLNTPKSKVHSCFSSLHGVTRRLYMAHQIKGINLEFERMNKKATELCLQSIVVNAPDAPPNASVETNSFIRDPIFIGRDDEVSALVTDLTDFPQEKIFSILAIVGMGGMGKTTLTRKLFNHQDVKDRFGSRIWVHVSQTFDPIMLFKKILSVMESDVKKELPSQTSDAVESEESVLKKLEEPLKGKTYLLVLDDVWNEDVPEWERFIGSMSGVTSTYGNAIIITTRSDKVASLVGPLHIHSLKGLSDEDCWSIIKAKAFENGVVPSGGFEMIGREISKRCKNLPLAANIVGGVLLRCKSEEEWDRINEKWVSDDERGENISKVLKLSYDHLPSPSLKKCFTYCSIFPKGTEIQRQEVIEQWMAEGFLQGDEMESVGNKFLNVLLHNSLLLPVGERYDYGNVKWCVMHDLVHDMASFVLGYSNSADGITRVRYWTLKEESPSPKQVPKHLRVLTVENYKLEELLNPIRKMIHLRNLNISRTSIEKLPDWIGELYHLQTLRAECRELRELPSTVKCLINLRHLHIDERVELPAEIGRLICLQTLRHFRVGDKKGYQIEELGSLNNLKGMLSIWNLEKVHGKEEALKANICQKPNLFELNLNWEYWGREGEETNDESVLEGLQPHPNLKKLRIEGFKGKRFPLWSEKMAVRDGSNWVPLNNLIEIRLERCEECEEIPKLEHLPNLKSLSLKGLKKVRFINSSFKNLTRFYIDGLEGLECLPDWLFYNNQNLSDLRIWGCPKLRELPDGLHTLNSLEELSIYNCENLRSIGNPSGGVGQSQGILRNIDTKYCPQLRELPDGLLTVNSLEELSIYNCENLRSIGNPSGGVGQSQGILRRLHIQNCPQLRELPDGLLTVNSLEELCIENCENLRSIGNPSGGVGQSQGILRRLHIQNCPQLRELPDGLHTLNSLEELCIENCENLRSIGNPSGGVGQSQGILRRLHIQNCPQLRELPDGLHTLNSLEYLTIGDCENLRSIGNPSGGVGQSQGILRNIDIKYCPQLRELPNGLLTVNSLEELSIYNCENLRSIGNPSGGVGQSQGILRRLYIENCPQLRELPDGLHTLNSLEELCIENCENLRSIGNPSGGVGQSQGILRHLIIRECGGLMELPRQMVESWAPSLQYLVLRELSSLENLPMLIDCLAKSTRLESLTIVGVPKLMAACTVESWDLGSLESLNLDVSKEWSMESSVAIAETVNGILQGCCNTLTHLYLKGSENWEWLPESIQHLTFVERLYIENSGVEELPQWFGNLSSLRMLDLLNCKKLRCLPCGNALERKLCWIGINDCPELVIDSEWRNIRDLSIKVDGRLID